MAIDYRAGRSYSGPDDQQFMADSVFWHLHNHPARPSYLAGDSPDPVQYLCADLGRTVAAKWGTSKELAAAVASAWAATAPRPLFKQAYALARVFQCNTEPAGDAGDGVRPVLDGTALAAGVAAFLDADFEKLGAATAALRREPTLLGLVAAGDAAGLRAHLAALPTVAERGAAGEAGPSCGDAPPLEVALMAADPHGRNPLGLAALCEHAACITELLAAAGRGGRPLVRDLCVKSDGSGVAPLYRALNNTNSKRECVLAFLAGGADFWAPLRVGHGLQMHCALEVLVKSASKSPLEYMPLLREVLAALAERDGDAFSVDRPLRMVYYEDEEDEGGEGEEEDYEGEGAGGLAEHIDRTIRAALRQGAADGGDGGGGAGGDGDGPPQGEEEPEGGGEGGEDANGGANGDAGAPAAVPAVGHRRRAGFLSYNPRPVSRRRITGPRRYGGYMDGLREAATMYGLSGGGSPPGADGETEEDRDAQRTLLSVTTEFSGLDAMLLLLSLGAQPRRGDLFEVAEAVNEGRYEEGGAGAGGVSGGGSSDFAEALACAAALVAAGGPALLAATEPYSGETALHAAAHMNCVPMVRLLLEAGADAGARSRDGATAAQLARESGAAEAEELLTRRSRLQRLLSPGGAGAGGGARGGAGDDDAGDDAGEVPEDQMCCVCYGRRKEVILAPCGHKCMCKTCTRTILSRPEAERNCPIDKIRIESYILQVYE